MKIWINPHLRLLAETREFRHAETAKLPKLVSQSNSEMPKCQNAETAETAETVSQFRRRISYDIHIVLAF